MNTVAQNKKYAVMILFIGLAVFLYWIGVHSFNVYDNAVMGAVYEMTALLTLAATFILPVFILVLAGTNRFRIHPVHYISLGILVITILMLFTVFNK